VSRKKSCVKERERETRGREEKRREWADSLRKEGEMQRRVSYRD